MSIQRDTQIKFHEKGTLAAVTRWISSHDEGIAEWLKNAGLAYQPDRADVEEKHRAAVLLLQDADIDNPACMGLLDVGGATLEDVTRWSLWQDPEAWSRGSGVVEEMTQGNGGKAYMYRLFTGPVRILGVRDGKLNCKGFEGPSGSLERGTPGFMPDTVSGREVPVASWEDELKKVLELYHVKFTDLPKEIQTAIRTRKAFTLVEGVEPLHLYKGRIDAEDLVHKVSRHDQSTLAVQQLRLYTTHNGRLMNGGKPLQLEPIAPYPGFETPLIYEIDEELPDDNGNMQSTTLVGTRPKGRVILYTSRENMPIAYKKLRPRWEITYRTEYQMIGSKPVSDLVPATPGSYFIYGTVELSALEPDYVAHGRVRPNDGPLVEAVDLFVAEKIRGLAKQISEQRRHEQDEQALDEVHEENRKLDQFKNRFLPSDGPGPGPEPPSEPPPPPIEYGTDPDSIEIGWNDEVLRIGKGVRLHAGQILYPRVRDATGRIVPDVELEWMSNDSHVVCFNEGDSLEAVGKGQADIWVRVKGRPIESVRIPAEVWIVDHVLLTPRSLDIPLRKRKQIIAEVTNDDGNRATNILLNWEHDADDPLIVRIRPTGWVTGNRLGRTTISAGAGDPSEGGVWARIRAEVTVVSNPEAPQRGEGFPSLKLTDRDIDPSTGEMRPGDPDQPALWQEVVDYQNNIWWLNLESAEAAFAFSQRPDDMKLWRLFHAQKVVEMVVQVHMQEEFTKKGENERPDLWVSHKATIERYQVALTQRMWEKLQKFVLEGGGLD